MSEKRVTGDQNVERQQSREEEKELLTQRDKVVAGVSTATWPGAVVIDYTNHRGERRRRKVQPLPGTLRFRETPDHKPAQWVFDALDLEREGIPRRTFALLSLHSTEGIP